MIAALWLRGLLRRRAAEVAGVTVATALAVAFLAALGSFVAVDRAHLTVRAAARVATDWQVQATAGSDPARVVTALRGQPHVRAAEPVDLVTVAGLSARTSGALRTTGQAVVVGLPAHYPAAFPAQLRLLVGTMTGPLLLQQTASNLAATPGSTVQVLGAKGASRAVRVAGVVDMPQEDSFFQTVGAPTGVGPSAPPDNVLLVPLPQLAGIAGGVPPVHQVHVGFDHRWLPADPARAAVAVAGLRHHFEAQLAGAGLVADNLGVSLSAAREDALYGELLFLLLGLPAFGVALTVVGLVVASRSASRRRELGLLRMRGAGVGSLIGAVGTEAAAGVVPGALLGWPAAGLAAWWAFGRWQVQVGWLLVAAGCVAAVVLAVQAAALLGVVVRNQEVVPGVRTVELPPTGQPRPLRVGLDLLLLSAAALVFWLVSRGGYQVVVAPEGITTSAVNWAALLAPALAWPGLALLVWRLADLAVSRARTRRPKDGRELVFTVLRRRRLAVARAATVLAVAIGAAGSTAVFTATYRAQSRLDVALTVGADVAVALPDGSTATAAATAATRHAPSVHAVSTQTHRFAYVGQDLQDMYGVDPSTVAAATPLRDAFVPGATIPGVLDRMRRQPAGVLLSAETLHDYQLRLGDGIVLRVKAGPTQRYTPVHFTVLGQVAEWPTAPKDSFIVANAGYLQQATGQPGTTTILAAAADPAAAAGAVRARLGTAARVSDVASARESVVSASGLAATDLGGLARLELGFGALLAVAAFALALLVAVLQRRRALVILGVLGASPRQRRRFLAVEARAILGAGLVGGTVVAATLAAMLVKVMTGIFDPPPDHPAVPVGYFAVLFALTGAVAAVVVVVVGRWAARAGPGELRDL